LRNGCVFCAIIDGEISAKKIYETAEQVVDRAHLRLIPRYASDEALIKRKTLCPTKEDMSVFADKLR